MDVGLKGRFHQVNFEDFDAEDLKLIWCQQMKERTFECDDRVTSIVAQKLSKLAGKGFANARAVRTEVGFRSSQIF